MHQAPIMYTPRQSESARSRPAGVRHENGRQGQPTPIEPRSEPKTKLRVVAARDIPAGVNYGVGAETLRAMEIKKNRNIDAMKAKYGVQKHMQPRAERGSKQTGAYLRDEDESSEDYENMVQEFYKKKKEKKKEISNGHVRLLSSKHKRAESNYSQKIKFAHEKQKNKELDYAIRSSSYKLNDQSLASNPKVLENNIQNISNKSNVDLDKLDSIFASLNFPKVSSRNNQAISISKYSVQQNSISGYGSKFAQGLNSGSELYNRYLYQLQKANYLQVKAQRFKKDLKNREEEIIGAILSDSKRVRESRFRLNFKEEEEPAKKEDFLSYSKNQAKPYNRAQELAKHFSSDQMRNSEGNSYIISNLRKIDEDAAMAERATSNIRRPLINAAYLRSKDKQSSYMNSIRSKFRFLEAA